MIIQRLILHNFCQHRHLELVFTQGLNMLVGPNGAGKTNALRALQFAITGDAGGDRKKSDDIHQGMQPGEESYVEMHMTQGDASIVLRRGLEPTTNLLRIGKQSWTSVGEINAEIWRRLGATKKQISDYVFVRQRKIDDMFDQPAADRAASLAALFGLEHAERVYKKTGEFISAIEIPTVATDIGDLERRITAQAATVAQLNVDYNRLNLRDATSRLAALEHDIHQYQAYQSTRQAYDRLKNEIGTKQAQVIELLHAVQNLDASIEDMTAGIAAIAADVATARVGLTKWQSYHNASQLREQLQNDCAALQQRYATLEPPPAPAELDLTPIETDTLDKGLAEHAELTAALRTMDTTGMCPTCGQMLPNAATLAELRAQREARCAELLAICTPLSQRREAVKKYNLAFDTYTQARQAQTAAQDQLDRRAQALQNFEQPDTPEAALQAVVDEHNEFQSVLARLQVTKNDKAAQLAREQGMLDTLVTQRKHTENTLSSQPNHSQESYAHIVTTRDDLLIAMQQGTALQRQITTAEAALIAMREQLQDAKRVLDQGAKTRATVEHMTQLRNVFHRNEAPRVVSYTYIEAMLDDVNKTLELFDAPYRVVMDDSLGFTAHFLDGVRVQPDRRLSVGERIVLAMAFRITVNSTFANRVGVLVMDEPTAGLDEHNLGCLPRALERLRDLSAQRGLQVLFVTHEPRIEQYFDNTIELSAA